MGSRPSIGVVAISYNEARDLPGFLSTVRPWVDELVIVDGGSSDGTQEAIRSAGSVRLIVEPMAPSKDFARQRNLGIEAATADWLLHMDIDERPTPQLVQEIRAAIRDPAFDAYRIPRLNFFLHREVRFGRWSRDNAVRLGRREALRFGGAVHERAVGVDPERVGQIESRLWHLGDRSYLERLEKNIRYSDIEARNLIRRGRRIGLRHLLAYPLARALRAYLEGAWKMGVLGVIFAVYHFVGTFNWFACAWDRQHSIPREALEERVRKLWGGNVG